MSLWVPSPNFNAGRPAGGIRWVVWHSTESPQVPGAAYHVARNWFGVSSSQVSSHVVVDDGSDPRYADGACECVKPGDRAWHCGPGGNPAGYGVEIVGFAAQSLTDWLAPYSAAALHNACRWVLSVPVLAALPRRFLTDTEVRSGASGHITHAQVSRVLGGTTHTDPGAGFPYSTVEHFLTAGAGDVVSAKIRQLTANLDDAKTLAAEIARDVAP